jgi:hypothetical protein
MLRSTIFVRARRRVRHRAAGDSPSSPLLNAAGSSATFPINLLGKISMSIAILAISVDLLWGYTGLLSLGPQALSSPLGRIQCSACISMLRIGKLGSYATVRPEP